MVRSNDPAGETSGTGNATATPARAKNRRSRKVFAGISAVVVAGILASVWLVHKASIVHEQLQTATGEITILKEQISNDDAEAAKSTVERIRSHTMIAKEAAGDPWWTLASSIPWVGTNFAAVAEIARSADDIANLGLAPLVSTYESLDWNALVPSSEGSDLEPLKAASPKITSAAHAVRVSGQRLDQIDANSLLPQVAAPLVQARSELHDVTSALNAAADASSVAPAMMGSDAPRSYLLMIQNNAEARASGGIPGALAVLTLDKGRLSLGTQSSAADFGTIAPVIPVDPAQQQIYSGRLGKFMQDVNLTPDFPTAASTAQAMWEQKTGQRVEGVVSIDPIVLSYVLDATGPVKLDGTAGPSPNSELGLPTELTGQNVVRTLLSDVYAKIDQPKLQDAYFAAVAQEIFTALSDGKGDAKGLIAGITRGTQEGRVLMWSSKNEEQAIISRYSLSGAVGGPSVSPAQFGVYFNDGTGAKMDYYVERTVQLIEECPRSGYEQTTVRITSTNTAPLDAATALPEYVTGGGAFGVPAGSVETNIVAYGPVQAVVETAMLDGQLTGFAPYLHDNRPVGVLAIRLGPGESRSVDFTFGKIVQHAEPNVAVTPTVQDVKNVILPTKRSDCA